jgi:Fe2+ or Zn2+ uptake regulation protein
MIRVHLWIQNPAKSHQSVLNALGDKHLTSFELFKRVESISIILSLYNVIDDLKNMGLLHSYNKKDERYHYINT